MSFEDKQPSVRVMMDTEEFNKLISLISDVSEINIEDIKKKADDIKDKALKFTQPKDNNKVLARFYPSQVEILLLILLSKSKEIEIAENYYRKLIENRENYKKQKENI